MSLLEQGIALTGVDQIHNSAAIKQETCIHEPTISASADQRAHHIDAVQEVRKEKLGLQPAPPPQSMPQYKGAKIATPGQEEAPESDQARIERLGRERPAKFQSFGAELGFCYSVIASQFMSVCIIAATPNPGRILTPSRNISFLVSTSFYPP